MTWRVNTNGRNRFVILTRRYAVKVPSLRSWQDFLYGLLNNRTEARVGTSGHWAAAPVLWHVPGGWLVVMPRLPIMTRAGFEALGLWDCPFPLSVERKPDSFGLYNGRVVAVDYGWDN